MYWGPALSCKLIAIWVITRWMKNRYADPTIRVNYSLGQPPLAACSTQNKIEHNSNSMSRKHILTIRVPQFGCKPHSWRAQRVIVRKSHYGIKETSLTAKQQLLIKKQAYMSLMAYSLLYLSVCFYFSIQINIRIEALLLTKRNNFSNMKERRKLHLHATISKKD